VSLPVSPANEETFDELVLQRSHALPVVVDFWADWCGPCKALSPALEAAAAAREGKVELVKVDVDANQRLAALYRVQGIPAVKAFRDGEVVEEFTGALPPARVEAFFDKLVPSRVDDLLAAGDELSLREAAVLEPSRADVAVALGKARLARGAEDEALDAVSRHESDFAAAGIAARIHLSTAGIVADGSGGAGPDIEPDELRDLLRRAAIGILSEIDPADPTARTYRRKLATALG
jgi:putative thioredoxin